MRVFPEGTGVLYHEGGRSFEFRGSSILHLIVALPLITSAFVDIPARVQVGPVSGLGAWTTVLAVLAAGGVLGCGTYPRRLLIRVLPYLGFLVWMALSMTWSFPDIRGIQNGILYTLLGSLVVISGVLSSRYPARAQDLVRWSILWIDCISLGIVLLSLVFGGLPREAGVWWFGPRGMALLGLIPLSWHLAGWFYGMRGSLIPACLWLAAIASSLSRTAMAISLVLLGTTALLHVRFRLRKAVWSLALFVVALTIAGALLTYSRTFRDRFFGGDTAMQVGGARINTEGRLEIWDVVVASAREKPILGKGIGSSQLVLRAAYPRFPVIDHPHNDYLRLWHDLGVVGVLLFSMATGTWLVILFRNWRRAERWGRHPARLELAAAMGLFGVLLAMLTDNVIVYVFVMGPLGVLVGTGMGLPVQRPAPVPSRPHQAPIVS